MSEATASLALNRKPGVSADTRERVLKAAKALGYSPNTLARGLATRQNPQPGAGGHRYREPVFREPHPPVDEFILEAGYNLILSVSNDELELEPGSSRTSSASGWTG